MKNGNYVSTNNYFSSFYIFTALHGLHLLGGLFFWGKVFSKVNKLKKEEIIKEQKSIDALSITPLQHILIGSFLFGTVFMASEPVTSTHTNKGRWIYGFLGGFFSIMIRVFNPAYPEGVMMAVLTVEICTINRLLYS